MALSPDESKPVLTDEDKAAADAAEKKIDAYLPRRRGKSVLFTARAVVPENLDADALARELGDLSYPALLDLAQRYRDKRWHAYSDSKEKEGAQTEGVLKLVQP